MLRNFKKFEIGHYYVYTGGKTEEKWNPSGGMAFALRHEILQCSNNFKYNYAFADFKGHERVDDDNGWDWSDGFDNWVEVESPDAVFVEGDSVLEYIRHHKQWKKIVVIKSCTLTEDEKENGYDNGNSVYYILKRKTKENKEDIVPNVKDFTEKQSKALENLIDELEKMSKNLGIVKVPPIPMTTVIWKDNPFKKYIRKKKYLTFSKKK